MCQYCSYRLHDGWGKLLEYDETYQSVMTPESQSTYGFHASYEDLREDVGLG